MPAKTLYDIELASWSRRASDYDALFAPVSTQAIGGILDSLGILQGKRHLDVACGTGHLVAAASKRGALSEGIDFASTMIEAARTTYPEEHFQVADAGELSYNDRSFDAVTCAFGLSHMENPQAAVDEAFRVLNPGGRFAFTLWFGPDDGGEVLAIVKAALATYVTIDIKIPNEWTRLRNADEEVCTAITAQAGFGTPVFSKLPIVWQTTSAHAVDDTFDKLSVRTKMIIDRQPPAIQQRIHEYILAEAEARRMDRIISLAWPALLTVVQKPT
jgi:SAM-dependent methyltransferase